MQTSPIDCTFSFRCKSAAIRQSSPFDKGCGCRIYRNLSCKRSRLFLVAPQNNWGCSTRVTPRNCHPCQFLGCRFFQKPISVYHLCHPWQFWLRFKWSHSPNYFALLLYSTWCICPATEKTVQNFLQNFAQKRSKCLHISDEVTLPNLLHRQLKKYFRESFKII